MILAILEYLFLAIFFVIMGFYLLTLISLLMIEKLFHVKHRKGCKYGKSENTNDIKTDNTEHNKP